MLPIVLGIVPMNLLEPKSKLLRLIRLPTDAGIVSPINPKWRLILFNEVRFPIEGSSLPLKLLLKS